MVMVMAGEEATESSWSLEFTPTWAVATVCFVLISISLLIEYALHHLTQFFHKRRRKSLIQALDKIKSELMLFGFISFSLTVSRKPIQNICIPKSMGETFLPCQHITTDKEESSKCQDQGKISLLSTSGVEQLQMLIFVVAAFHVFSCFLTFSLGMAKMKTWESWEAETRTLEYQFSNDPRRFQLIHQTSFGRRHLKFWSDYSYLRWPVCFLRQFYKSVPKPDYFTLRHGFIMAHFAEGSNFDFQKYIKRALEKDFGVVVGISFWICVFSVTFIFLLAHVFYHYLWLPFIPLVMLLTIGTKLQGIVTTMCLQTNDKSHVVRGILLVRPNDDLFWFGRPKLLLHLMHYILFQNSFQLAFFTWSGFKFGLRSCFHEETEHIVIKLIMGMLVQVLCGYVTLPLYALVTQMGTLMNKAVFTEGVVQSLKRWRAKAKKDISRKKSYPASLSLDTSVTSLDSSPSFDARLEASFSLRLDNMSVDDVGFNYSADQVGDEEGGVTKVATEQSLQGFDSSKMSL